MSLIKKIRIKNFKSLEDVEIEIKPLTFLFGPNSSGKSSFIKAMMFLSKNLFPMNTGKTIYKISDDVDLGSYKDIVTNNDENRNVVFEIDMIGEFDFPIIDVLKKNEDFINWLQSNFPYEYQKFEKENIFILFEKLFSPSSPAHASYENNEFTRFFSKSKFDLTIIIQFTNFEADYNLTRIIIKDNIQLSEYKFVRKDKQPNEDDGEGGMVSGEQFVFLNNKNVSRLFNYGYYEDDLTTLFSSYLNFTPQFNLYNLVNLPEIKSSEFNKHELMEEKILSKEWEGYEEIEKIEFYYEVLKFCYLSHRLLPNLLKNFLSYKHLPITRETAKKIYLLERNNFNPTEYYGILNILAEEFCPKESDPFISDLFKNRSYEEIFESIIGYPSIITDDTLDMESLKQTSFLRSLYFDINNNLRKLGFNQFYSIELKDDIGRIYLIGKDNMKMYMSNASSGFIQVFPIIVCCCLYKKVYDKADFLEKNTIEYVVHEFKDKYDENELLTDFQTLLIEQPELHLHPKLQAQLAEIFADTMKNAIMSRSLIIETHSEHLIRKIQVLIAKGELDKEKVGVWYFDNIEGKTKIKEMIIEPNGFFKEPWPNGFFDDSANLSWELLTANKN